MGSKQRPRKKIGSVQANEQLDQIQMLGTMHGSRAAMTGNFKSGIRAICGHDADHWSFVLEAGSSVWLAKEIRS